MTAASSLVSITSLPQHVAHRQQHRWQALVYAATTLLPPLQRRAGVEFFGKSVQHCAGTYSRVGIALNSRESACGEPYLDGPPQTTDHSWDGSLALCHRWMATFCTTRWPEQDAFFFCWPCRPTHSFGPLACLLTCSWVLVNIQRALTWKTGLAAASRSHPPQRN